MSQPKPGASVVMAIPKGQITPSMLDTIFQTLLEPDLMRRSMLEMWRNEKWYRAKIEGVIAKKEMPCIDVHWAPPRDGPIDLGMMLSYYVDAINRESLRAKGLDVLSVWVYDVQLEGPNADKFRIPLEKFQEILSVVKPPFALLDHYSEQVKRHKTEDLRSLAWGATVYGANLVEQIGKEKLLHAPAWTVENLPWGGVWVQAAENPFAADTSAKKAIERHLNLATTFADSGKRA